MGTPMLTVLTLTLLFSNSYNHQSSDISSAGPYGSGQLLYPMRTGNHYRYLFTPNPSGPSVIELHEYALFRYGTVLLCNTLTSDGGCGGVPVPPTQCEVAKEETKVELTCPSGEIISEVLFADYGEPTGTCTVSC